MTVEIFVFCVIFWTSCNTGQFHEIQTTSNWNWWLRLPPVIIFGSTNKFPNVINNFQKSVALQLGVHLILLYFITIWILSAETFFLFWCGCGCGCWWRTFFFFKFVYNDMVYTLGIGVYFWIWKSVQNNFVMGLIFVIRRRPDLGKSKPPFSRDFIKNHAKSNLL